MLYGGYGITYEHAFDEGSIVSEDLYRKLMFGKLEIDEGMLIENIVAQMLNASGYKLYFYSKSSRTNSSDRMEIDFLISKASTTNRHNICPLEVKPGKNYTLTSLKKLMAKYDNYLSTSYYVLHDDDLKIDEDGIVYLPLYMTPLL